VLPEANARAFTIEAQANAYKAERINMAQGRAARFTALLEEYKKAPEITRQRLLLENLDAFLPSAETVLITGEAGNSLLPHLGLKTNPAAPARN
jgi:membrane protease subunit HflK